MGYFVGERINIVVSIIGSPFEGLGTAQQGLSLYNHLSSQERITIYKEFSNWIFSQNYASFVQIEDMQLSIDDVQGMNIEFEPRRTKYVNLSCSEDELYSNLHDDCKYSIRKAKKNGIYIRETLNVRNFIDEFYEQFTDVFKKHNLHIVKSKKWYYNAVSTMYPQHMMLLEAVTSDGNIAATGIILVAGKYASTWQTASYSKFQHLRPNEILRWEAMRRCKRRGVTMVNMCGTQAYKDKFGAELIMIPRLYFYKWHWLLHAKRIAKSLYYKYRQLITHLKKE